MPSSDDNAQLLDILERDSGGILIFSKVVCGASHSL